jgi:ABC-type multidrug transport system ATPase subunit
VADVEVSWREALRASSHPSRARQPAAPALVCSNVSLRSRSEQGTAWRIRDVSFALKAGQMMAIIGSSGAGKTTLLRVLTGALRPSEGMVLVHGDNLHLDPEGMGPRLGYVPQDDIIHAELCLRDALSHCARLRVAPPESAEEVERRILSVARTCGLHDRLGMRIRDLSGGERKRASIAVELLTSPGIMYLDEPTSGLDPALERTIMQLGRKLADEGRIVVITTHTTRSIELCDLVLIMAPGGQVVYFGPTGYICQYFDIDDIADVYERISTDATAAHQLAGKFRQSRIYSRYVLQQLAPAAAGVPGEIGRPRLVPVWVQMGVLLRRQIDLFMGDEVNTGILLAQAPIIALIVAFMFPGDSFSGSEHLRHGPSIIFMLTIAGIWFGVSNSAREIVKERPVHQRERAAGLSPGAYLISKLIPLSLLAALQTLIMFLITGFAMDWFDLDDGAALMTLWGLQWLAALAGVTLGLVLSCLARSTDQAISLTPVVLLPQIVFSGVFSAIEDGGTVVTVLTHCTMSHWCFGAAGNTVELSEKLAILGMSNEAFDRLPSESAAALAVISVIMLAAAYAQLKLSDRR